MSKQYKIILTGAAFSFVGAVLFTILFDPQSVFELKWFWIATGKNFATYFVLWIGNRFIFNLIDKKISWVRKLYQRLGQGVLYMGIFSSIVILVPNYIIFLMEDGHGQERAWNYFYYKSLFDFLYSIILILALHSNSFYLQWKKSLIKAESLQKENLESQLASLKSQISPHFLFNSLNVLSTLVHTNAHLADQFINRLSQVYRYLLENKDKEVIELGTELEFVRSYLFLLETRFGDNLKVEMNDITNNGFVIPPIALQMLIENAIKHNEISEKRPLKITVKMESNDYLSVTNNLQLRKNSLESTHIGLGNIKKRYSYLTDKEIIVSSEIKTFTVQIPLLKFSEKERKV